VEVVFHNTMGESFRMDATLIVVDGRVAFVDERGVFNERRKAVFRGTLSPGEHTLQVLVRLSGEGQGKFAYLRGYKFEVKSSHKFVVAAQGKLVIDVFAWEKGTDATPLEQRPAVCYAERVVK
jgi:hypothetical protein